VKITMETSAAKGRSEFTAGFVLEGQKPDLGADLADAVAFAKGTGDLKDGFRKVGVFHPPAGGGAPKRLALIGLGKVKALTAERIRRGAALAQQTGEARGVAATTLVLGPAHHKGVGAEDAGRAVAEGLVLGAYQYQAPSKKKPEARKGQACKVRYTGAAKDTSAFKKGLDLGRKAGEAVCFARDLENMAGNLCTPTVLARRAKALAKSGTALKVKVLDERQMEALGMGALLGVGRGSAEPSKLIVFDYKPAGATKTLCVVGKGITFDTGGISLKPGGKMDEMRYDMCGSGAVMGLFHALANGGLVGCKKKVRITGVIAAVENMPDGKAQKPGDIVTAMDGTTIEVLNTDAEGRLVLADALCYAIKTFKPDHTVDLATLTGAVVVALGHEMAGIMGNDDNLIDELRTRADEAGEALWPLPLWDVHKDQVKSKFADLANLNSPAHGNGSTAGGAFLSHFVGDSSWAHLDIAGAAWGAIPKDHYRGGATGVGVRTLLQWVRHHAK